MALPKWGVKEPTTSKIDFNKECILLNQWLVYFIDNHINHLLEQERIKKPAFLQMTPAFRKIIDYKKNELPFNEWKMYKLNNIKLKPPHYYFI